MCTVPYIYLPNTYGGLDGYSTLHLLTQYKWRIRCVQYLASTYPIHMEDKMFTVPYIYLPNTYEGLHVYSTLHLLTQYMED
jgi:hypothetical protein